MRLQFVFALAAMLIGSPGAFAQRQWIVYPSEYTGSGWFDMPSGNYDVNDPANPSRPYRWATGFDGERRAYWDITAENAIPIGHSDPFPAKPAFYQIEHWVPTENPVGVTWGGYTTVEVSFSGQPGEDEEGKINPFIPWNGRYRTNHQWLKLVFSCGTCNGGGAEPARWRQAGPRSPCAGGTDLRRPRKLARQPVRLPAAGQPALHQVQLRLGLGNVRPHDRRSDHGAGSRATYL